MGEYKLKGGKELPNAKSKKSGSKKGAWWKYLLMFFGGFFACLGVIVGGAAIAGTVMSLNDVVTMAGGNTADLFGPEFQNDTLLSFIQKVTTMKFETLGDVNRVTPMVKKAIDETVNPALKDTIGFEFNWEELKTKPFELNSSSTRPESEYDHTQSLGDYIPDAFKKGVTIGNFFKNEHGEIEVSGLLQYIVYKIEGNDTDGYHLTDQLVTIDDIITGGSSFFDNVMKVVKIGDLIDTSGNAFLAQMADWTVSDFTDDNIKGLKIASLFSSTEINANPLLKAIATKNWSIADISNMDNINSLKIKEIVDTSSMTGGLLKSIEENTIGDLQDEGFMNRLELKTIYPNATGILKTLSEQRPEYENYFETNGYLELHYATLIEDSGEPTIDAYPGAVARDENYKTNHIVGDIYHDTSSAAPGDYYVRYADEWRKITYFTVGDMNDSNNILRLTLQQALGSDINSNKVLKNFANTQLKDLKDVSINDVKLTDVLDYETQIKTNSVLKAIYDQNNNITIGQLSDSTYINNIPLGSVITSYTSGSVIDVLITKGATIGNLSEKVDSLTINEVLHPTDTTSVLYKIVNSEALNGKTLSQLGDAFQNLTIGTIIEYTPGTSPYIVYTLQNVKLSELSAKMNSLTGKDVLDIKVGDVYEDTNAHKYYIKYSTGWRLIEDSELAAELLKYQGEEGYWAQGLAAHYTGTTAPTSSTYPDAVARDSMYAIRDIAISDSDNLFNALRTGLTLNDVVGIDENSPSVLKELKDTRLPDIPNKLKTLTLNQIIGTSSSSSPILKMLGGVTVFGDGDNNLEHALQNLNLYDLFDENLYVTGAEATSRNAIRISFTPNNGDIEDDDVKLTSDAHTLGAAIVTRSGKTGTNFTYDKGKNMYFTDYLYHDDDDYSASVVDAAVKQAYGYVTGVAYDGGDTFSEDNNELTVTKDGYEVTVESYEAKLIDMSYWFMFTEEHEVFNSKYEQFLPKKGFTYTINDISKFTQNMTYHINNAKIRDLVKAGFIDGSSIDLTKTLKTKIVVYGYTLLDPVPYGGTAIGDLTIKQLLDVVSALLPLISE